MVVLAWPDQMFLQVVYGGPDIPPITMHDALEGFLGSFLLHREWGTEGRTGKQQSHQEGSPENRLVSLWWFGLGV